MKFLIGVFLKKCLIPLGNYLWIIQVLFIVLGIQPGHIVIDTGIPVGYIELAGQAASGTSSGRR